MRRHAWVNLDSFNTVWVVVWPARDAYLDNADFGEGSARYLGLASPSCETRAGERIAGGSTTLAAGRHWQAAVCRSCEVQERAIAGEGLAAFLVSLVVLLVVFTFCLQCYRPFAKCNGCSGWFCRYCSPKIQGLCPPYLDVDPDSDPLTQAFI